MGQLFNCCIVILELWLSEKEAKCSILGGTFWCSLDCHLDSSLLTLLIRFKDYVHFRHVSAKLRKASSLILAINHTDLQIYVSRVIISAPPLQDLQLFSVLVNWNLGLWKESHERSGSIRRSHHHTNLVFSTSITEYETLHTHFWVTPLNFWVQVFQSVCHRCIKQPATQSAFTNICEIWIPRWYSLVLRCIKVTNVLVTQ